MLKVIFKPLFAKLYRKYLKYENKTILYGWKRANLYALRQLTLKRVGRTSAGWPRTTNRREFSFRKLESKSSRHCNKNLKIIISIIISFL
jgi:hypothetical protein